MNTYTGTINITVTGASNSPKGNAALLPTSITLATGTGTANVTLYNAALTNLTITSTGLNVTSPAAILIGPATVNYFTVTDFATSQTVGEAFSVKVTPYDVYGNVTTSGTVTLTPAAAAGSGSAMTGNLYVKGGTTSPTGSTAAGAVTITNIIYTKPETIDILATFGTFVNDITTTADVTFARTSVVNSITVTAPTVATNIKAGTTYTVKVTGYDAWLNTVAAGTAITWSVTGTGASLSSASSTTDAAGSASITFTPNNIAGSTATVTATNGAATATTLTFTTVHSDTVAALTFTAPTAATAGTSFNLTVKVYDPYTNLMNTYAGTVNFTVTGASASPNGTAPTLPTSCTFALVDAGTQTVAITLFNAAQTTLVITANNITVTSPSMITVGPATVSVYELSGFSTSQVTNELFNVTITPKDLYGNVTTSSGRTLTLDTVAPTAGGTPAGPARNLVGGVAVGPLTGVTTIYNVKYTGVGYVDLRATDTSAIVSIVANTPDVFFDNTTKVGSIAVYLNPAYNANPADVRAGSAITVYALLLDANANPVKTGQSVTWSYTRTSGTSANGAVGSNPFTSATTSDALGYLTVSFTPSTTAGDTFTVSALNNFTGTSSTITVIPAATIASFTIVPAAFTQIAGTAFGITIKAFDMYGNFMNDMNNTQTLTFTGPSNAPNAQTPTWPTNPVPFVNGSTAGAVCTLVKAEVTTITVALSSDATVKGTTANITVGPAVLNYYTVGAPASAVAYAPFNVTITPYDVYGNVTVGSATVTLDARRPNGAVGAPAGILNGTLTANTSAGPITVSVTYNRVDTIDVHATDGTCFSNDTVTQDTSFSPNIPAYISVGAAGTTAPLPPLNATYPAGTAITIYAVVLDNVTGNNVADGTLISWTFTGAAPAGFGNPIAETVITVTTAGVTSVVFYPSTVAGSTYVVTAHWNAVSGSSSSFSITPAPTTHYKVEAPTADQTAGMPIAIKISAMDAYENVNTLQNTLDPVVYTGPSNALILGTTPIYPANANFVAGVANIIIVLFRAEETTLTATFGTITGTSNTIKVVPNVLAFYRVIYGVIPPKIEEYAPFGVTAWGVDAWYNERAGSNRVTISAEPVDGTANGVLGSLYNPELALDLSAGPGTITDLTYTEAELIWIVAKDLNGITSVNAITGPITVFDIIPPLTTKGWHFGDGLGNTSEAVVVFDEIMVELPGFALGTFAIDGIAPTSHTWSDAFTLHLYFNATLAGTEPKTVWFVPQFPAQLTDTAGNGIAAFSRLLEDRAEPVLLSYSFLDGDSNAHLNTITFHYSEPLAASSATLNGWKVFDHDGVTDLLAGLTDAAVAVVGSNLVFTLANNTGTTGAPYYMYTGTTVVDPAGNKAAHVNINTLPVVTAGPDQLDLTPRLIFLNGSATDANQPAHTLIYAWTLESGPASVTIVNADKPSAKVLLTHDGSYVFRLTVTDVFGQTGTDVATASIINVSPVSNAGHTVFVDRTLTPTQLLDGSMSFDPNDDPITYAWTGPAALNLTSVDTMTPAIAPSADGVFTVTLTVTDDDGAVGVSTALIVVSSTEEHVPYADAGINQHTVVGNSVQLDGRGTYDADSDTVAYSWTQISGTPVAITNANTSLATFTPTIPGMYSFRLNVHDGTLPGLSDTVSVLAISNGSNNPPVADAGLDKTVEFGGNVTLDAAGSFDVDGDSLTYNWVCVYGYAPLDDHELITPTYTPVHAGTYIFELTVSDGIDFSAIDTVVVQVVEHSKTAPVATISMNEPDLGFYIPATVQFQNTSYDLDGDDLYFFWEQTGGPVVTILQNTSEPSFTPVVAGMYSFRMWVTDGTNVDFMDITVPVNSAISRVPKASVMADRPFHIDVPAYVAGSGGWGLNGHTWVQVSGPTLVKMDTSYLPIMRFTPRALGSYTFALYAYNGFHRSLPAYVTIHIVTPDTPLPGGGGGGCFIATAAFGSMASSTVNALTTMRDSGINASSTTGSLVSLYYAVSPAVANELGACESARAVIRRLLDR